MRSTFAIRVLGGTVIDASHWLGVVDQAVRQWAKCADVKPQTRDRVIAAVLRKAAAEAQGLSSLQWWADAGIHNERLEHALDHHNHRFVELFRDLFEQTDQGSERLAEARSKPESAAAAA
jgi:hypothetical protein